MCKVIVPLLVGCHEGQLPVELRAYHAIRIDDPGEPGSALDDLLRVLAQSRVPLAPRHGVPALPPWYVPRLEARERLGADLFADGRGPVAPRDSRPFALLAGGPGMGKSVLAAAFASCCETSRHFRDGIVWISVGPGAVEEVVDGALQQALAPFEHGGTLPNIARGAALHRCSRNIAALFVLDDVWDAGVIEAFVNHLTGSRCRLLVSARDASLAIGCGGRAIVLDLMDDEPALALLHAAMGGPRANTVETQAIARMCAGLPLALALCGRAIADGTPEREIAERMVAGELGAVKARLPNYPYPTVALALDVSLRALCERERDRFHELVVVDRSTRVPTHVVARLWRHTAGYTAEDTVGLLKQLRDRSLIDLEGPAGHTTVGLHDLICDWLAQSGHKPDAHRKLLDAYRPVGLRRWNDVPDDGYLHDHLTWHLSEAGWMRDLFDLVRRDWFRNQLRRTKGPAAFIFDARIALSAASRFDDTSTLGRMAYAAAAAWDHAAAVSPPLIRALASLGGPSQLGRAVEYATSRADGEDASCLQLTVATRLLAAGRIPAGQALSEHALGEERPDEPTRPVHHEIVFALARAGLVEQAAWSAWALRRRNHGRAREQLVGTAVASLIDAGQLDRALELGRVAESEVAIPLVTALLAHDRAGAEEWARSVADWSTRGRALACIALDAARRGDHPAARRIAGDLEGPLLDGHEPREWVLREVPAIHGACKDYESMWRAVGALEAGEDRYVDQALQKSLDVVLPAGDLDAAIEIVHAMQTNGVYFAFSAMQVVEALGRHGDRQRAAELSRHVNPEYRARVDAAIAKGMARGGDIEGAITMADAFPKAERKEVLAVVAVQQARSGRLREALALLPACGGEAASEVLRNAMESNDVDAVRSIATGHPQLVTATLRGLAARPAAIGADIHFEPLLPITGGLWMYWLPDAAAALAAFAANRAVDSGTRARASREARELALGAAGVARSVTESRERCNAVEAAVSALLSAGGAELRPLAEGLVDEEIANVVADPAAVHEPLQFLRRSVAKSLGYAGEVGEALRVAGDDPDCHAAVLGGLEEGGHVDQWMALALGDVGEATLASPGSCSAAARALAHGGAGGLSPTQENADSLISLGQMLAKSSQIGSAGRVASALRTAGFDWDADTVSSALAVATAEHGEFEEATRIARSILPERRIVPLIRVAWILARTNRAAAQRLLGEIVSHDGQHLGTVIGDDLSFVVELLGVNIAPRVPGTADFADEPAIVKGLVCGGYLDEARRLAAERPELRSIVITSLVAADRLVDAQIESHCAYAALDRGDFRARLHDLRCLASAFAEAQEWDLARRSLGLNVRVGLGDDERYEREYAAMKVAEVEVRQNRVDEAFRTVAEIDATLPDQCWAEFAGVLARHGHCDRAVAVAMSLAETAPAATLRDLVREASSEGHHRGVVQVLPTLFRVAATEGRAAVLTVAAAAAHAVCVGEGAGALARLYDALQAATGEWALQPPVVRRSR
ncbi:MAG: NB-ARC domain-containing protein [Myxococcota bacterium]